MITRFKTVVAVMGLAFMVYITFGHSVGSRVTVTTTQARAAEPEDEPLGPAPELTGVTDWVNSKPMRLADQKGKVVIVHFWTNGCINCIHNYPHYRAWTERYKKNSNLLIVGIHTPEFDAEKNLDRLKERAIKNNLSFPIAVDNDGANWKAWGNEFWPAIYLVDKAGNIRQRWDGELGENGYKTVTAQIDKLLSEPVPSVKS